MPGGGPLINAGLGQIGLGQSAGRSIDLALGGTAQDPNNLGLRAALSSAGYNGFPIGSALAAREHYNFGVTHGWWGQSDPQAVDYTESPTYGFDGIRTTVGSGFLIPKAFGELDLGGHIIFANILDHRASSALEFLAVIIALCEGRCHSVGGLTGGASGEIAQRGKVSILGYDKSQGDLPENLQINRGRIPTNLADGVLMHGRMGDINQRPLPADSPFKGTASLALVNGSLNDTGQSAKYTVTTDEVIGFVDLILVWPQGCYEESGSTIKAYKQEFDILYRVPGRTISTRVRVDLTPLPFRGQATRSHRVTLGSRGVNGPLEFTVERVSPKGSAAVVSQCNLRQVSWSLDVTLSYPGICYEALLLTANEKIGQGGVQVRQRGKWRTVRVWDATHGWSDHVFDVQDLAGTAFGNTWRNPPGRNPAWQCLEYLLAKDCLGTRITERDIDLQSFRNWADHCDGDLVVTDEPRYQCDIVHDVPKKAWEWVSIFGRAGRARIVPVGQKIVADYDYRYAHGRGLNFVPERAPVMLVSDANAVGISVGFLDIENRPSVIQFQFSNRAKDFARDLVTEEDPDDVGLNAPYVLNSRKYVLQTYERNEVTSATQLRRDAIYMHRMNRLVKYRASWTMPREALAARVGDVVLVQSDVVRPFGSDVDAWGWRTNAEIPADSDYVVLDHDVTLKSGVAYSIHCEQPEGTLKLAAVTQAAGTYTKGTQIALQTGTKLIANKGAVCIVGEALKMTLQFQIRQITIAPNNARSISAIQYDEKIHEDVYFPESSGAGGESAADPESIEALVTPHVLAAAPDLESVTAYESVQLEPTATPGRQVIRWGQRAEGLAAAARVYVRAPGAPWSLLGETRGTEWVLEDLAPGTVLEVSIAGSDQSGTFQLADSGSRATLTAQEFPALSPPDVESLTVTKKGEGEFLQWPPVLGDVEEYEVRQGQAWLAGRCVYRGRVPEAFVRSPVYTTQQYHVRARSRAGVYSGKAAKAAATQWLPDGMTLAQQKEELIIGQESSGTRVGLHYDWATGELRIAKGKSGGTYTSTELDLTTVAQRWWWLAVDFRMEDLTPAKDLDFLVSSGEARWRFGAGREPTLRFPGIDLSTLASDLTGPASALPDTLHARGPKGQIGQHAWHRLEVRYHDGTVWGAWEPAGPPELRTAQKIQARLTMRRESQTYQLYASDLFLGAAS